MKIKEGFVLRQMCGENIVAGEGLQNINFNKLLSLNESAAYLWKEVVGKEFTQEEMADRLGISLTAYRDLEKGGTSVVHGNVIKMAELLETSTEEIVLGYRPSQMENGTLEDVRAKYGNQICTLEQRVGDLEKLVCSLEGQVASKDEIIKMLKKRLDEVE